MTSSEGETGSCLERRSLAGCGHPLLRPGAEATGRGGRIGHCQLWNLFNLQTSPGGGARRSTPHLFLSTLNLIKLHQYVTIPVLIYLVWFREPYYRDNTAAWLVLASGPRRLATSSRSNTGQGPQPPERQHPKGAGRRRPLQQRC